MYRPRDKAPDVEMRENTPVIGEIQDYIAQGSTGDEENPLGAFTPTTRQIPPPFGYAPGLVPTSSHPLQEELLDTVPRPALIDNGPVYSSATTSVQPISASVQREATAQLPNLSNPSIDKLASPFQFKSGENRPTVSRKRLSRPPGRAGKYKGLERGPILEDLIVEKTRVVEQQALATRQLIDQKSAELDAQAEKTRLIEQEGLTTKQLLKQREERIIQLEAEVDVYKSELMKVMARLDKLEENSTKKDHQINESTGQVVVISTPSSSNPPLPSGEDIHMVSAVEEGSKPVVPHGPSHKQPSGERMEKIANEADSSSKNNAKERGHAQIVIEGNDFGGDDSEGNDSEGNDFSMYNDNKGTEKGKGKKVTWRGHHCPASNDEDDMTAKSDSGGDDDIEDDEEDSNDEKCSVPKPIVHFQRPQGGAGPRLRVDPTKPFTPTSKPIPDATNTPMSGVQPLGMTPEQIAAIVQIVLVTQGQTTGTSVAPERSRKKNVTGTIVEQLSRTRDPRTGVLVSAIRRHMNKLLQVKHDNEICKLPQPTKDAVEAFAEGEGRGPKLIPMQLAFAYKKKELWNARLAEMFFDDFLEDQGTKLGIKKSEWPIIYDKFWQQFSNLKKEWKNWQMKDGEDDKEVEYRNSQRKKRTQMATRRDSRRHHLKDLRIEIMYGNKNKSDGSVDDVWYFLWVVATKLGLGGTSSDESSVESGSNHRKFVIKSVAWRSRELIPFLQIIDWDFNWYNCYGNAKPGNPYQERMCLAGATPSTRSAIKGLPGNFYDKTWLLNLTSEELILQPEPKMEFPVIVAYND